VPTSTSVTSAPRATSNTAQNEASMTRAQHVTCRANSRFRDRPAPSRDKRLFLWLNPSPVRGRRDA
jgi:hypothetical protein